MTKFNKAVIMICIQIFSKGLPPQYINKKKIQTKIKKRKKYYAMTGNHALPSEISSYKS